MHSEDRMIRSSGSKRSGAGRLLVLTGIDGAGKSTVLGLIERGFPEWEVGRYDPSSWIASHSLPHLAWMLERDPRELVGRLTPASRASFLGHMVLAHWESWLRPRLEGGATVVMDSFFFRHWAREQVSGGAPGLLEAMVQDLPMADGSVMLEVPPEVAAARKGAFDAAETGGGTGPGEERAAFVAFQQKVAAALCEACRRWSRSLVLVPGQQPPERVAEKVVEAFLRSDAPC